MSTFKSSPGVIRPRTAAVVCGILSAALALSCAWLFIVLPDLSTFDRTGFLVLLAIVVWFLWRQASVKLAWDDERVTVRGLFSTRVVEWEAVFGLNFSLNKPWATLDLTTGETLQVMAIQGADGERAVREARRFAGVLARHEGTSPADTASPTSE